MEVVTLTTLADGAAVELFQEELRRVLENIQDPNTEPEDRREIVVKVQIAPNAAREVGECRILVGSKLAPIKCASTVLYMGHQGKEHFAVEQNPKQIPMFQPPATAAFPAPVAPIKE